MEQTIINLYNFIKDISKDFGDIPAAYATLIDLDKQISYNHIMLVNATDADIIIKFTNSITTSEYTVPANSTQILDNFLHNNIIEYKYVTAPTSGYFKLTSWLGASY